MLLSLEEFLKMEMALYGQEPYVELIQARMRAKAAPESLDAYFSRNQAARGHYQRAIKGKKVVSLNQLAKCLREMGLLSFTVDFRYPPWNACPPHSVIAIITGARSLKASGRAHDMHKYYVSARDMECVEEVANFVSMKANIDCRIELHHEPFDLSESEAAERFDKLRKRKEVSVIVVLGSPVVNPMAQPMAHAMFSNPNPLQPPAAFRWSYQTPPWLFKDGRLCRPEKEGIYTVNGQFFPRVRDDIMMEATRTEKAEKFNDCGILMVCDGGSTVLVLAAGHGACGTLACIKALQNQSEVAKRLIASREEKHVRPYGGSGIGRDRMLAVIAAERGRPSSVDSGGQPPFVDNGKLLSWRFT